MAVLCSPDKVSHFALGRLQRRVKEMDEALAKTSDIALKGRLLERRSALEKDQLALVELRARVWPRSPLFKRCKALPKIPDKRLATLAPLSLSAPESPRSPPPQKRTQPSPARTPWKRRLRPRKARK